MRPHEVLGVPDWASAEEVKQRFRELALLHHPDHGGDPQEFMRIKAAYDEMLRLRGEQAAGETRDEPWFHSGPASHQSRADDDWYAGVKRSVTDTIDPTVAAEHTAVETPYRWDRDRVPLYLILLVLVSTSLVTWAAASRMKEPTFSSLASQFFVYGAALLLVAGLTTLAGGASDQEQTVSIFVGTIIALATMLFVAVPLPPFREARDAPGIFGAETPRPGSQR